MITNWEGKVILAVEDDEISLEFLNEIFEPYKVSLLYAYNGQTAIDICSTNPSVELILMDVQLPVLNGKTAMQEIKKFRPELPIIAQTAFAMSGDKERYIEEGFDDYVSKPINVQELLALVKKYLG
jgi:two-component system, cell cycle response regulator DivK